MKNLSDYICEASMPNDEITKWFSKYAGARDTKKRLEILDDGTVKWKGELRFSDCSFTELPEFITISEIEGALIFNRCAISNFRGFPSVIATKGVKSAAPAFMLNACKNITVLDYLPSIKGVNNKSYDYSIAYCDNLKDVKVDKLEHKSTKGTDLVFSSKPGWDSSIEDQEEKTGKSVFRPRYYSSKMDDADFAKIYKAFEKLTNGFIVGEYTNQNGETWVLDKDRRGEKHLLQEENGQKLHMRYKFIKSDDVYKKDYDEIEDDNIWKKI